MRRVIPDMKEAIVTFQRSTYPKYSINGYHNSQYLTNTFRPEKNHRYSATEPHVTKEDGQ